MTERTTSIPKNITDTTPLYNSRILLIFIEYFERKYPNLDIDYILKASGITREQIEDQAHWFNQSEVDAFHDVCTKQTKDSDLARHAGRSFPESKRLGPITYSLGFLLPTVYLQIEKSAGRMTRATHVEAKKIGKNKVEIVAVPRAGVNEKEYQCRNRLGLFEGIAKLFTGEYADIDHTECWHRGGRACRYIISYNTPPYLIWHTIGNAVALTVTVAMIFLFFLSDSFSWLHALLCVETILVFFGLSYFLENKYLHQVTENQKKTSGEHIEEMFAHYDNSRFVQESSQVLSSISETSILFDKILDTIKHRLEYKCAAVYLKQKGVFNLKNSYGFDIDITDLLSHDNLENINRSPHMNHRIVSGEFFSPAPIHLKKDILTELFGTEWTGEEPFLFPMIFQNETVGALIFGKQKEDALMTVTELNLLEAFANQTAIGITNTNIYQKLAIREKQYKNIIQNLNAVIYKYYNDGDKSIDFISQRSMDLFGFSSYTFTSFTSYYENIVHPDDRGYCLSEINKRLHHQSKDYFRLEYRIITPSTRKEKWIWDVGGPITENGQCIGIEGFLVDITERKKSENILIESEKMKSDFITTASHELRTPLNMMAVNISALAGGYIDDLPDEAIDDLKLAERSIQHMTSIVDELLDLSKIESHNGENSNNFKVNQESAQEVIGEVISEVEKTAHEHHHCIKQRLDNRLDTIHINKTSFRQVLINLLNNAIKYTPKNGGIIVKTELKDDKALISVIDNGYGVPGWAQDKIFDKFYQADNILPKRYGKFGGMGIGLSVSKVIIEQHGGTLSFISPITDHPDYRFDDLELGGDRKGSAFIIALDHKKRGEQ